MKVKVEITKVEEVHLSEKQMKEVTIATLRQEYNLEEGMYVKNGKLMQDTEYYTHRSMTDTKEIREATENDIVILNIIKGLR